MPTDELVRSELLCFLQQKSKLIALDHVVTICADFYNAGGGGEYGGDGSIQLC